MKPIRLTNEAEMAENFAQRLPVSSPRASSETQDDPAITMSSSLIQNSSLRIIGKGFCGTVWAASDKGPAFKREDGGPDRSLKNDFEMHHRVLEAFHKFSNSIKNKSPQIHLQFRVPACYDFIKATNQDWWSLNQRNFPQEYTLCNMIKSQRISPISESTRELLITKYCPSKVAEQILTSESNRDCLIRPYLGRRRTQQPHTTSRFTGFSLRNYPLHIDQMQSLGIIPSDIQQYARIMAETLAIMHWISEIDGNDIEFVLAPPDEKNGVHSQTLSNALGDHSVWVLDFDLCRRMTMDLDGVKQAADSFWGNDPYYPRPGKDPMIWTAFRERYIQISGTCIELCDPQEAERRHMLPSQFIELIEQQDKGRTDEKEDKRAHMEAKMY